MSIVIIIIIVLMHFLLIISFNIDFRDMMDIFLLLLLA